jgi:hypothetical protein
MFAFREQLKIMLAALRLYISKRTKEKNRKKIKKKAFMTGGL